MTDNTQNDNEDAFAGTARLYGTEVCALIRNMHVSLACSKRITHIR